LENQVKKLIVPLLVAIGLLVSCAGVTDVVSTGKDTYMIASHGTMGWSSGGVQKAQAFTQANEFCQKMGKTVEVINSKDSGNGSFGKISSAEISFKCVGN
jgi:hypothetical protein